MAEFCLDCFNKINETAYKKKDVWLEEDFCEGCVQWKPCIVALYPKPIFQRLADKIRRSIQKE